MTLLLPICILLLGSVTAGAQDDAAVPKTFALYSPALRDSIRINHRLTSDSTSVIRLSKADNRWLAASYEFENTVLWTGVPVDFSAKTSGAGLCIRYSFLGNRILGNVFCFVKAKGRYSFTKKSEFQELPDGREKVCPIRTTASIKSGVSTYKAGTPGGKCTTR